MYTTVVKINTQVFKHDDGVQQFCFVTSQSCLVVEFKVEIRLVELVQTNVTIFTTAGVCFTVGMESQRIDGTKMTLYSSEFLFKHQMKETGIEFTDTCRGRRHVHGVLTTTQHDLQVIKTVTAILNQLDRKIIRGP